MRTGGAFNVVAQNLIRTSSQRGTERWMNNKWQLCWRCQKDKPVRNGSIKMFGPIRRFICADCIAAKRAAIAATKGAV